MKKNVFQGHNISFKEIVLENKLGGSQALNKYIKLRSSQIHRIVGPGVNNNSMGTEVLEIIDAFQEAQKILTTISSRG